MSGQARRFLLIAILVSGCAGRPDSGKPAVAVSVIPLAYVVDRLAGDSVDLQVMIPPGANEATHEPTLAQMKAVSRAVLYVKVGHPGFAFETTWLDRILETAPRMRVVDASAGGPRRDGDPHVWLSTVAMRRIAGNTAAALTDILPGDAAAIRQRLSELFEEIDAVERQVSETLAGLEGRRFYVFHPAWGYFAEETGLVQVAIEEDGKEPSPAQLARVIERAREDRTAVVFTQPQFSHVEAEEVASAIGAELVSIDPLARDWPANLVRTAEALSKGLRP